MNTKFKIDESTIANILINKKLLIPVYQRSYTWGEEHINALLDDLMARDRDGSSHYFGVIALTTTNFSTSGKDIVISKVIDGQQRLTTSLILLTYLARNCKEIDDIASHFLENADGFEFEYEMDDSTLKNNITNLKSGNYLNLKGKFKENFDIISNKLNGFPTDYIQKLYKTFKDRFIVATLTYDIDSSEEMLVFENLNSKGSPLKAFDLVRNHIISLSKENTPKYNLNLFNQNIWNLTQTLYKNIAAKDDAKEDKLERFIELFTIFKKKSKLSSFTNYSTYKNFKEQFRASMSSIEYEQFLFEIRRYEILFLQIEMGMYIGKNIWLKTLSNKDNHYPFVFALFEKFSTFDRQTEEWQMNEIIDEYLKVVSTHVVKLMSVMGTGQSLMPMWIDIMENVVEKNVKPNELKKMLSNGDIKGCDATPSDEEFKLSLLQTQKQRWIPYALIDILEYIAHKNNSSNEWVDYVDKTVEHILPQNAKINDWPFIENNDEEYKKTVNQIGNLVNFNGSANSKLGNKSFIKKLEIYKDSNSPLLNGDLLGITPIFKEHIFTFETIKKRTEQLSKILIDFWKK